MSDFQLMLVGAFVLSVITASFGYQYQALFYLLLCLWGGFTYENFVAITLVYLILFVASGAIRLGRGGRG